MRWIIPKREVREMKVGDIQVIKLFLVFPLQLQNKATGLDEMRWWESVEIEQEWNVLFIGEWGVPFYGWISKRFVNE